MHRGGTGTPLLLHGVSSTWRAWSPILAHLEAHHDVIAPTLPGHGGGPRLSRGTSPSVGALADGIEAVLDRLGLKEVHIAGNSLGGWVGIELARRGRARSLVLFSPAGAWPSRRSIEFRATWLMLVLGTMRPWTEYAANPLMRQLLLAAQVSFPERVAPEELAVSIRANDAAPLVAALARAIPQNQVEPLAPDCGYPVRLAWGDRDRVLPCESFGSAMESRLPGAETVTLSGAGHVPMSDDPTEVADLILQITTGVDAAVRQEA
ncbi:pimeloyl-ACP methyl ester carboxylesterase [Mycobacterium sp. OTB74]|nr:alpha/beta hydrolase [Mycobacterium sp. OTB74]MDH6247730.1 pimeloyl-ACP methyl ester carboxylesterase [Mycobacterium sp. OTB74]